MSSNTNTKTAQDVIVGALRKIGEYQPGDPLSAEDANDGLDSLNGLLDMLSTQHFAVYNNIETVKTLTPGQVSYTLGTGGDINIERPLRITQCYSRITTGSSPVDFPCDIWPIEQYSQIGLKQQPGPWPKAIYYNTDYPLSTIYMWPVPNQVAEFHIWSDVVLNNLNLTDTLNLPRGYFLFLQFALAEILAPEYGRAVPPDVARLVKEFKRNLKSLNANPSAPSAIDAAMVSTNGNDAGFIIHGGF